MNTFKINVNINNGNTPNNHTVIKINKFGFCFDIIVYPSSLLHNNLLNQDPEAIHEPIH